MLTNIFCRVAVATLLLSGCASPDTRTASMDQMRADVAQLIDSAQRRTTLWPWKPAEPEVALVAAHGPAIAPLLLAQLVDDPNNSEEADWNVQQQIALALCTIYSAEENAGHVFMNRALREKNARVKPFWVQRIAKH